MKMMEYALLPALIFILVLCSPVKGQSKTGVPTDIIKSIYGPCKMARGIMQDKRGNIWLASPEGIIRYDVEYFTNITSKLFSAKFLWYDGNSIKDFKVLEGQV